MSSQHPLAWRDYLLRWHIALEYKGHVKVRGMIDGMLIHVEVECLGYSIDII